MWFEAVQAVGRLKDVVLCATLNPAIPGSNGTDGKIRYFHGIRSTFLTKIVIFTRNSRKNNYSDVV